MNDASISSLRFKMDTVPTDITRFCAADQELSFARYGPNKDRNSWDVYLEGIVKEKNPPFFMQYNPDNNKNCGLSCFELKPGGCYTSAIKSRTLAGLEVEYKDRSRHTLILSASKTGTPLIVRYNKSQERWFCWKLEKGTKLPSAWELIQDQKEQDSHGVLFQHFTLRRVQAGVAKLEVSNRDAICNLEHGVDSINELPWKLHCFQIKASALHKTFEDFDDLQMVPLYNYFMEWIGGEHDLDNEEEIVVWLTKNRFENLVNFTYAYEEISTRFQKWLQDHEHEEARDLFEKITVLLS